MSAQAVLAILLFAGMALTGKRRGIRAFVSLAADCAVLYLMLLVMAYGADPVAVTEIGCVTAAAVTLFYTNGAHRKTAAALLTVALVMAASLLLLRGTGAPEKAAGFGREQAETLSLLDLTVPLSFPRIAAAELLVGLLGSTMDVAISIASPVSEIAAHRPEAAMGELFRSGMRIGRDVLATMVNTLVYVYVGESVTLLLWFGQYRIPPAQMFRDKLFCTTLLQILAGGIAMVLVIPLAAGLTAALMRMPMERLRRMFPRTASK